MKPMAPMEPLKPAGGDAWWPGDLGQPASSGGQGGLRYAVFPEKRRLAVERDGATRVYDTGDRRIGGVAQSGGGPVRFTDRDGTVDLGSLREVG